MSDEYVPEWITRIDAARRQIRTAVRLHFESCDPVTLHTLVTATHRLISELAKLGLRELPQGDFDISQLPAVVQAQVAVDRAEQKFSREQRLAEKRVNTVESY